MIILGEFREPNSVVRHEQPNTKVVLNKQDLGVGTLYITESLVSWNGPQGFSIEYPHISMHAYSKDPSVYSSECLYLLIDTSFLTANKDAPENAEDNDSDSDSVNDITELLLVPEDLTALPRMYEVVRDCQELHPDPEDVSTDEDEAFEDMIEEEMYTETFADANDGGGGGGGGGDDDVHVNLMQMMQLRIEEYSQNGFDDVQDDGIKDEMDEDRFEDAD